MRAIDEQHPGYGFATNVGYFSPAHHRAILAHGPTEQHRASFQLKAKAPPQPDC